MSLSLAPYRGVVIAAVDGGDLTDTVVRTGHAFAKAFAMELRLVSVVDPVPYDLVAFEPPMYPMYPPLHFEVEERLVREREAELRAILGNLGSEIHATACVSIGAVATALINEAINKRANLIITGYHAQQGKTLAAGLSTALTLMHDAPLPVLAVTAAHPFDVESSGLRLMLADDLRESTREAACKAYELAARLPNCHFRHVHVHHEVVPDLMRSWRERTHHTPGDASPQPELTASFRAMEQRKLRLAQQGLGYREQAERAGVIIETDLRSGKVEAEIRAATDDCNPDLLIFGRHRMLRARPFLIGQMPFKTMLHHGRSVLIVPPREDLYARMPFPAQVS